MNVTNTSEIIYKGVCFDNRSGKFVASLRLNGFKLSLGSFDNAVDASDAYQEALVARKNGAYDAYDDAYAEYMDKIKALSLLGVPEVSEYDIMVKETSRDFYEWIEYRLGFDVKIYKSGFYNDFISDNPNIFFVTPRRFFTWVGKYVSLKGYYCHQGRDAVGRWIFFSKNN